MSIFYGGFFSLDSKFMQVMSRVADLIILNVIYLVTCLPVITIGAASTALYTVLPPWHRPEEVW